MRTALSLLAIATFALGYGPSSGHASQLVDAVRAGDLGSVRRMLDQGDSPNAVNSHGESALGWGSFNGQLSIVKELLTAGADVNRKDALGNTPVLYAAAKVTPTF